MTAADEARQSELDAACAPMTHPSVVAFELFDAVDVIRSSLGLRRAFTDPASTAGARRDLARRVFGGRLSDAALDVLIAALDLSWRNDQVLLGALERQGVRILLKDAAAAGQLGAAIEQLHAFEVTVRSHNELREALRDSSVAVEHREELVASLTSGKVLESVEMLLRRAVRAGEGSFILTLERYLQLAAQLRQRQIAHVAVARQPTPEQIARLREALVRQAGSEVDLQIEVDPSVIGGMSVKFGDDLIESTVAGRLEDVQRQFST